MPLVVFACGGNDGPAEVDTKMAEAQKRIRHMEDSLFDNRAFDLRSAQAMVDVYKAYVAAYPLDSRAPEYLFRAAGTVKSMHDPEGSLKLYDRIIKDYPSWKRNVDVLYMKALTLDDDLDRLGEARVAYQQVINNFPDHLVRARRQGDDAEPWAHGRGTHRQVQGDAGQHRRCTVAVVILNLFRRESP
ncbi:MAG: tetratricopeptide repeat protein [Flavobacteriales bacterium]|nr:tetratricopeptide repeat protein [Flavobacteriales bacterium]